MRRAQLVFALVSAVLLGAATVDLSNAQCNVNLIGALSNPQCGATFEGGLGMSFGPCGNGLGYNTPDNLYITIPGGVYRVDARIEAIHGGGQAIMYFYSNHVALPDPIISPEGCGNAVLQTRIFQVPVDRIVVSMINVPLIINDGLITELTLWEGPVSTQPTTWGRVKAMYRAQLQ